MDQSSALSFANENLIDFSHHGEQQDQNGDYDLHQIHPALQMMDHQQQHIHHQPHNHVEQGHHHMMSVEGDGLGGTPGNEDEDEEDEQQAGGSGKAKGKGKASRGKTGARGGGGKKKPRPPPPDYLVRMYHMVKEECRLDTRGWPKCYNDGTFWMHPRDTWFVRQGIGYDGPIGMKVQNDSPTTLDGGHDGTMETSSTSHATMYNPYPTAFNDLHQPQHDFSYHPHQQQQPSSQQQGLGSQPGPSNLRNDQEEEEDEDGADSIDSGDRELQEGPSLDHSTELPGIFPRIFVWIPTLFLTTPLMCPECNEHPLTDRGWNSDPIARIVEGPHSTYYIISKRLQCGKPGRKKKDGTHGSGCGKSYQMYHPQVLDTLPPLLRNSFPAQVEHMAVQARDRRFNQGEFKLGKKKRRRFDPDGKPLEFGTEEWEKAGLARAKATEEKKRLSAAKKRADQRGATGGLESEDDDNVVQAAAIIHANAGDAHHGIDNSDINDALLRHLFEENGANFQVPVSSAPETSNSSAGQGIVQTIDEGWINQTPATSYPFHNPALQHFDSSGSNIQWKELAVAGPSMSTASTAPTSFVSYEMPPAHDDPSHSTIASSSRLPSSKISKKEKVAKATNGGPKSRGRKSDSSADGRQSSSRRKTGESFNKSGPSNTQDPFRHDPRSGLTPDSPVGNDGFIADPLSSEQHIDHFSARLALAAVQGAAEASHGNESSHHGGVQGGQMDSDVNFGSMVHDDHLGGGGAGDKRSGPSPIKGGSAKKMRMDGKTV